MRAALAFLVLLFAATLALAGERIENFVSDVTVQTDGSLEVRETITVRAEGYEIRRGILRDFPTDYRDRLGNRVRAGFEVLSVRRDGRNETFAVESIGNGKRIKIGNADVFLDVGSHSYEITYRTTRQLGFFADYDELYWNVTGNGWTFPIDLATTIIRLPRGAQIKQSAAYTGRQGAQGQDFSVLSSTGGDYRAETTRVLTPGEGFTVAVAWQKGIVAAPTATDKFSFWLWDNLGLFLLLVSIAGSGAYYLRAWNKVGRDPEAGTIIPLFRPPEGLGPGGARFVWKQGFDDRAFAASLVGLAVKGRLRIIDDDGDFTIEKKSNQGVPLTGAETKLHGALSSGKTKLEKTNHVTVRAIRSSLETALKAEYEGTVFIRNLGWLWKGVAISAAGLAVSAIFILGEGSSSGLFYLIGTAVILVIMGLTFLKLLRAPTVPGRRLLDQLEGFRMYMTTAEEERLKVLHPPEKTPQLFEKYLPYALALDCENEWNTKFASVLAAAAAAGATAPLWYSGSNWNSRNLDDFTGSLGSSLSSTISSASTAPGSSSGSGGGGSSGGGGGGGGGSGW